MKESQVEQFLRGRIRAAGGLCWKFVSPGNAGVPDRIVILPGGRVYFVELKTKEGRLSEFQKYQQHELDRLGADVRTLYGMEDVRAFLAETLPGCIEARRVQREAPDR